MPAEFIELVLAGNPDACILIAATGQVKFWNRGAEEMFGYAEAEALGASLFELISPADDVDVIRRHFQDFPTSGVEVWECVARRRDGSRLYADVSVRQAGEQDGTALYVVTAKDVTQIKVQRDAKMFEARFRGLLESTPDAIVMINKTRRIVLANSRAERLFGYERGALLGQPIEALLPQRFRSGHLEYRVNSFAEPMGAGLELFGLRKDEVEFPVEISFSPLETEEGTLVMSAIRDITERKLQNLRVQEANRLKSEFLANMSHELRTPLNGIIGFSEFLVDEKPGPLNPKQREYLQDILNSGRHLLQLINDVLDLSKIEAGKMELNPETFSVAAAIAGACSLMYPMAAKKGIHIKVSIAPELDTVTLDPSKFTQVLYNLLSNAVKFTDDGGEVQVVAGRREWDSFQLQVRDTGIGIRSEDFDRLFREFVQLESGATRHFEGTGLGLALTKKIVEVQNGTIDVASQVGKGSTFTVVLPLASPTMTL
jgi:PAS domain S-box-containing protein